MPAVFAMDVGIAGHAQLRFESRDADENRSVRVRDTGRSGTALPRSVGPVRFQRREIRVLRRGLAADEQGGDPGYGSNSNQEICDGAEDVIPTAKRFQRHSPTTILKADFTRKLGNSREG